MELLILILSAFAIIQDVAAYPAKGHPYKSEHCIKMTPQKEQEINKIITRITDFLNNMTIEFEDFDIRLVKLDIERHSEDEIEEKDLKLQLTVNDCTEYTEFDEDEVQMSKENNDSNDKPEKDVTAEVPEDATEQKPDVETTSQSTTAEQTTLVSTTQGNSNGCEKCPCVCDSGNQNKSPSIKEEKHDKNLNKDDYEANDIKTKAGENDDQNNLDSDVNEANATRNEADTSKNIVNGGKNKTVPNKDEENQTNTIKGNNYDVTPIETIMFYDFGEDTSSKNNKKDDTQAEITKIYTFSNEVETELQQ